MKEMIKIQKHFVYLILLALSMCIFNSCDKNENIDGNGSLHVKILNNLDNAKQVGENSFVVTKEGGTFRFITNDHTISPKAESYHVPKGEEANWMDVGLKFGMMTLTFEKNEGEERRQKFSFTFDYITFYEFTFIQEGEQE